MSHSVCAIEKRKNESEGKAIYNAEASIIYQDIKGHADRETHRYVIDESTDKQIFARTCLELNGEDIEDIAFYLSENSYFRCLDEGKDRKDYHILRSYREYGSMNSYTLEDAGDDTYCDCFVDMAWDLLKDAGMPVKQIPFDKQDRKMKVNIDFLSTGSSNITDRIESAGKIFIVKSRLNAEEIHKDGGVFAYAEGPLAVENGEGKTIELYHNFSEAIISPFFKVFLDQKAAAFEDMVSYVEGLLEEEDEELDNTTISYETEDKII